MTAASDTVPDLVVAPSLLAAGFLLGAARSVDGAADWLHIDIMDNQFVPNQTIGLPEVEALRAATTMPFDTHLMIVDPHVWATRYAEAGCAGVTFHAEACDDPVALAKDIRAAGAAPGLAIDRDTPVDPYLEILAHFDLLLVMSVNPGFGGQSFIPDAVNKVRQARALIGGRPIDLEVDGGINPQTAAKVVAAGADVLVAGNAILGGNDATTYAPRLKAIRDAATTIRA